MTSQNVIPDAYTTRQVKKIFEILSHILPILSGRNFIFSATDIKFANYFDTRRKAVFVPGRRAEARSTAIEVCHPGRMTLCNASRKVAQFDPTTQLPCIHNKDCLQCVVMVTQYKCNFLHFKIAK